MSERNQTGRDCYCDDEIDLYELWLTLKKRKAVIFLSVALFLLLSTLYAFLARPVYRVEHYFAEPISETLPAQLAKGVSVLNSYLEEKDYARVADLLSLPRQKVRSLVSVEFSNGKNEKGVFSIAVDSYDPALLREFDGAVVNYLKSLPSVASTVALRREELEKKVELYRSKVREVTELVRDFRKRLASGKVEVVGFNPVELETSLVEYQSTLASLERQLQELSPFKEVAVAVLDEPVRPKRGLIVTVSLISGLFVGLFLALFLEWLERVREKAG